MLKLKPNVVLAALAVGALYLVMTRKAAAKAATGPGAANRQFFQSPAAQVGSGPSPAAGNSLIELGLGLANRVLTTFNQPLIRPAGYTPGYFPDAQGEAQALDYYATHADQFAANTPLAYITNNGIDPNGGWADNK